MCARVEPSAASKTVGGFLPLYEVPVQPTMISVFHRGPLRNYPNLKMHYQIDKHTCPKQDTRYLLGTYFSPRSISDLLSLLENVELLSCYPPSDCPFQLSYILKQFLPKLRGQRRDCALGLVWINCLIE